MRVVVFGLGYLGATHAACMAELGHEVLGVEIDDRRRSMLEEGQLPFYEPDLPELLQRHLSAGTLRVTSSYQEAADFGEAFFVAVGTPQKKGEYAADLSYVEGVVDNLVPLLKRDALILGKSTVPVGTSKRLAQRVHELCKRDDIAVEIAWNPEFLREGHAIEDTLRPDRLVLGVFEGGNADNVTRELYRGLLEEGVPYLVMDTESAEMVKVAANSFLATKISFINAIADICEGTGADVTHVSRAIGLDPRIGSAFLNAGIGFGGGCLPKDIRAFMARAAELGAAEAVAFLREVDQINMRRRQRVVDLAKGACGGSLLGKQIGVLGAAFKPNSDDVRDSPALNIAGQIQLQGAHVTVYDPRAIEPSRKVFPTLDYARSMNEAAKASDVLLILTEWTEFREANPRELLNVVAKPVLIDGRYCIDKAKWEQSGWRVYR
ncbi:UDP-glucose dehydrogenase family protein [Gordonia amicalis]